MKNKMLNKSTVITIVGVVLILVCSIWKSRYGLGGKDVSWYITVPYRAAFGDVLFWDEWLMAQLSSLIFVPITKMYLAIVGSSEGIMLASRLFCIAIHFIIACLGYSRIRKYGKYSTYLTFAFLLYVPFNHTMLSYNSIGVMAAYLGIIIFATAQKNIDYFVVGMCYGFATLCQPLLVLVYFVGSVIILINSLKRKEKTIRKKWCIFSLACVILSIPFIAYFVFITKIDRFMKIWPIIQKDLSKEHNYLELWKNPVKMIMEPIIPNKSISLGNINVNVAYLVATVFALLLLITLIFIVNAIVFHNDKIRRLECYAALILATIQSVLYCIAAEQNTINSVWVGWIVVGIVFYKGQENRILKRLFVTGIVWGIAECIGFLTSNGGGNVFVIAWFPASIFGIGLLYNNSYIKTKSRRTAIAFFLIVSLSSAFAIRMTGMFYDKNISNMQYTINSGPAKNIKVNEEDYRDYYCIKGDLQKYNAKNKKVILITEKVWSYLFLNGKLYQNSMYLKGIDNNSIELIKKYLDNVKKEKVELVYMFKRDKKDTSLYDVIKILGIENYSVRETKDSYIIIKSTKHTR